jgi:DNA polymerase-3 subunit delta'
MSFTADAAFDLLQQARARGRFAQAYLITGPEGSGKRALAERLAGLLLEPCAAPLKHPDAHALEPQMKSRVIGIEAMRDLLGKLQMRSLRGGAKIAVVHDADRMNEAAANALLRTLEDPPGPTYFFLLSTQPERMLTTILSRCIEIPLRPATRPAPTARQRALLEALAHTPPNGDLATVFGLVRQFHGLLAEARMEIEARHEEAQKKEIAVLKQVGASKEQIEDREDFYKALVESHNRGEREALLAVIEQWFADALRHQHGAPGLEHAEFQAATAALAQTLSTAELLRRAAALAEVRESLASTSVQEQLALECGFLRAFGAA